MTLAQVSSFLEFSLKVSESSQLLDSHLVQIIDEWSIRNDRDPLNCDDFALTVSHCSSALKSLAEKHQHKEFSVTTVVIRFILIQLFNR
jgi:hypothetical protein